MTTLETDRLILRPWTSDDVDVFVEIFAIDDVMRFSFTRRGQTREESEEHLGRLIRQAWASGLP